MYTLIAAALICATLIGREFIGATNGKRMFEQRAALDRHFLATAREQLAVAKDRLRVERKQEEQAHRIADATERLADGIEVLVVEAEGLANLLGVERHPERVFNAMPDTESAEGTP